MAEAVRVLRKQGAKNREINQSLKEVMKMIHENREKAKQERVNAKNKTSPEETETRT